MIQHPLITSYGLGRLIAPIPVSSLDREGTLHPLGLLHVPPLIASLQTHHEAQA